MDKGIYTALSGGMAKSHELELIANNLANVNTPGFKKDSATFNEYLTELRRPDTVESLQRDILSITSPDARPEGDKSFVELDAIYTEHKQGSLTQTNRPLDVALEGQGFLEVLTPSGIRYTRQGNLSIDAKGQLVTTNGFQVLKAAPGVTPEARFIQFSKGSVSISSDGEITQNNNSLGKLSIQEFNEPQWLEKSGNSYYRNTNEKNLKIDSKLQTNVHQGFTEASNVNPIQEMTRLIEATRAYESHMHAIKTYQDMDTKTVNQIAR